MGRFRNQLKLFAFQDNRGQRDGRGLDLIKRFDGAGNAKPFPDQVDLFQLALGSEESLFEITGFRDDLFLLRHRGGELYDVGFQFCPKSKNSQKSQLQKKD